MKIYFAGKINPNSELGDNWRESLKEKLEGLSGQTIENLDPMGDEVNQGDPDLVFGRCCFLISEADLIVAFLSDDVSIGGSQEILIAKHFGKPVIGIAPKEGKFNKKEKVIEGKTYNNYMNPFVEITCDVVVETPEEIAEYLKKDLQAKDLSIIQDSIDYYKEES